MVIIFGMGSKGLIRSIGKSLSLTHSSLVTQLHFGRKLRFKSRANSVSSMFRSFVLSFLLSLRAERGSSNIKEVLLGQDERRWKLIKLDKLLLFGYFERGVISFITNEERRWSKEIEIEISRWNIHQEYLKEIIKMIWEARIIDEGTKFEFNKS